MYGYTIIILTVHGYVIIIIVIIIIMYSNILINPLWLVLFKSLCLAETFGTSLNQFS